MIYLYEDNEKSNLSSLMLSIYPDWRKYIDFSEGAGNLRHRAKVHLSKSKIDYVVAFIDAVPNNADFLERYNKLRVLSTLYDYRCIILPIVCAEYYFIASLSGLNLYKDSDVMSRCLVKTPYADELILSGHSSRHSKTFETYCKFLCDYNLEDCCRSSTHGGLKNRTWKYGVVDCLCTDPLCNCEASTVQEKAIKFLSQFPFAPLHALVPRMFVPTIGNLWRLHRQLVDEFNCWSQMWQQSGVKVYGKIQYVR